MEQERATKMHRKQDEEQEDGGIQRIPDECLVKAISMTCPADACRAAVVSAAFRSAADSDAVWERFLPPDCDAVLERAVHLVDSNSKKELFMDLSDEHVLLDDGKRSFGLLRSSGAKCYMLSVSEMGIAWVTADIYWRQRLDPDSRFSKVAELVSVCWFIISGHISTNELSPSTHYAGYLVFKLTHDASGLASRRQKSFVRVGGQLVGSTCTASLHLCNHASCASDGGESSSSSAINHTATQAHEHKEEEGGTVVRYPRERTDGWLEFEIGDFHTASIILDRREYYSFGQSIKLMYAANNIGDEATAVEDVSMELQELEELHWKKGLIIEGIEIRPKS